MDRLVLAAGSWLPDLLTQLPAVRAAMPALKIHQEPTFHFPYRDPDQNWPAFIHKSTEIEVYGLPGQRDAGFTGQKVAQYARGPVIGSGAQADGIVDPVNRRQVIEYVERYLPGLVPEPYAERTCLFTMTPEQDFVIDQLDGVTVLSACSGHGAKFAPLLGRLAADVATGAPGETRFALHR